MLHEGFICSNLSGDIQFIIIFYCFFYFYKCRLIKILYKLTMFMYCPNRSVSAS